MSKFYIFIQKILKLKRKLSAKLGYNHLNSIYKEIETGKKRKNFRIRSKERLMELLRKKYQTRSLIVSRRYEKWI